MSCVHLEDEVHIKRIRQHLWCGREFGRAAVMVGAGFSRNAEPVRATGRALPLLSALARRMYAEVHALNESDLPKEFNPDPLKIAAEYEHVFKREALDELLIQCLPDFEHAPGRLHQMLLSMPWSDIFTTNYDTLLERARAYVNDRKYDLVNTAADIATGMKPRIVKLHGSFPSHRPFIVTDEDYRAYPKAFASLVNMVQQSIMENAFCLIGFSGSDPNFNAWAGWVRDNLGAAAPPIYLCGLLGLSSRERSVLEKKGVIPIDLSPIFPASRWPNPDIRHARALEWLLISLANGQTADSFDWPRYPDGSLNGPIWMPSSGLPETLSNDLPRPSSQPPKDASPSTNIQKHFLTRHQTYPNWLICPKHNREMLRLTTTGEISALESAVKTLSPVDRIEPLYELAWTYERLLCPIESDLAYVISTTLETINPFPHQVEIVGANIVANDESPRTTDWLTIGRQWTFLAVSLLRAARWMGNSEMFHKWLGRLRSLADDNRQVFFRCCHEACLWHIAALEYDLARKALDSWTDAAEMPFWDVRRAQLMAELGHKSEAVKLASEALGRIRGQLRPYLVDYEVMSEEGLAMLVSDLSKLLATGRPDFATGNGLRKRWAQLDAFDCNPWTEIERLKAEIDKPIKPAKLVKKAFDPGVYTHTSSFQSLDSQKLAAYELLMFFETGAIPTWNFGDIICLAATRIATDVPTFAFSWIVRAGTASAIDVAFDRVVIARMPPQELDKIIARCFAFLSAWLMRRNDISSTQRSAVQVCMEMLSRLTFRMGAQQRKTTVELAISLYDSQTVQLKFALYEALDNLFSRLLYVLSADELVESMADLLKLSIPSSLEDSVRGTTWPEPFRVLQAADRSDLKGHPAHESWSPHIRNLLHIVEGVAFDTRERASIRLDFLRNHKWLTDEELERYLDALWSRVDPDTGLPTDTRFLNSYFLELPGSVRFGAETKFRTWALSVAPPPLCFEELFSSGMAEEVGRKSIWRLNEQGIEIHFKSIVSATRFSWSQSAEGWRIEWTQSDAVRLLVMLEGWLANQRAFLHCAGPGMVEEAQESLDDVVDLLACVILPRLSGAAPDLQDKVRRVIECLDSLGADVVSALPGGLIIGVKTDADVAAAIRRSMVSNERARVYRAGAAVYFWHAFALAGLNTTPPCDLLDEMVSQIVARRQPGIAPLINQMIEMFGLGGEVVNQHHVERLLVALEYLLADTCASNLKDVLISTEERGDFRALGAKLAGQVTAYWEHEGRPMPPILESWRTDAQSDMLPEVRKAWLHGYVANRREL